MSVPSTQFFWEPKTTLKIKVHLKQNKKQVMVCWYCSPTPSPESPGKVAAFLSPDQFSRNLHE
jgi:hypothetical protein